jgi:hypothetical protein
MPGDMASGEVFLAITDWRHRCLNEGIAIRILSGGMGSDGWLDQQVESNVCYFILEFRVSSTSFKLSLKSFFDL